MTGITNNHVRRKPPAPSTKVKPLHPNIQKLFKELFRISLKQKDVYSIEEQREFGSISTGDKNIDDALNNSYINIYATINDMVEMYRNGVSFKLLDGGDSKIIFEVISEHTGRWRDALKYAMNMGKSPVEDLILMESFIGTIYDRAKFEYLKKEDDDVVTIGSNASLYDFLYGRTALRGTSYTSNGSLRSSNMTDSSKDIAKSKYNPDTDIFKKAIVSQMELNSHGRRN